MPKDKIDWINIIDTARPQYINPGEIAVTGRMVSRRMFTYEAAPTVNNDGFDSAGIGVPFYVGDIWRDISSTPNFTYSCDDNSQGAADWQLYGVPGIFGDIYVESGTTSQTIASGAAYTKITAFTTNGLYKNITPDAGNNKITLTVNGIYQVNLGTSLASGTNNVTFFGSIFLNAVEQDQCHWTRKVATAGDIGSASLCGMIEVTAAPLDLDFRVRHDNVSSIDLTISYANLLVIFVGKT
jgi:hypothetical protein